MKFPSTYFLMGRFTREPLNISLCLETPPKACPSKPSQLDGSSLGFQAVTTLGTTLPDGSAQLTKRAVVPIPCPLPSLKGEIRTGRTNAVLLPVDDSWGQEMLDHYLLMARAAYLA